MESLLTRSISIHAPREGGDSVKDCGFEAFIKISIHAPREGGDSYMEGGFYYE